MSLIALELHDEKSPIPIGELVVIDSTSLKPRQYDPIVDQLEDVIGTSYAKVDSLFRVSANVDGPDFFKYEYHRFNETLMYERDQNGELIENPNYDFAHAPAVDPRYVVVCVLGMAPVVHDEPTPARWTKIKDGVAYDLYLVR
jgi:hypothetical protein